MHAAHETARTTALHREGKLTTMAAIYTGGGREHKRGSRVNRRENPGIRAAKRVTSE
jgi:hypothetical protein